VRITTLQVFNYTQKRSMRYYYYHYSSLTVPWTFDTINLINTKFQCPMFDSRKKHRHRKISDDCHREVTVQDSLNIIYVGEQQTAKVSVKQTRTCWPTPSVENFQDAKHFICCRTSTHQSQSASFNLTTMMTTRITITTRKIYSCTDIHIHCGP